MREPDVGAAAPSPGESSRQSGTHAREGSAGRRDAIVIVGPCASGKSTLAENLVRLGYQARIVGQEHSDIQRLWQRHEPAVVIGLVVSFETVRARRGRGWSRAVYDRQQQRLGPAMAAATVVLDTGKLSPMATLAAAAAAIRGVGIRPSLPAG